MIFFHDLPAWYCWQCKKIATVVERKLSFGPELRLPLYNFPFPGFSENHTSLVFFDTARNLTDPISDSRVLYLSFFSLFYLELRRNLEMFPLAVHPQGWYKFRFGWFFFIFFLVSILYRLNMLPNLVLLFKYLNFLVH